MEHFLKITTEVNGEKVVANRKMWLEYPKGENYKCLAHEAGRAAAKITGISSTKIEDGRHYTWSYEEFDFKKHGQLDCVDLCEVYHPQFYTDLTEAK